MQKGVAGGQVVHRGVSERCCSPFAGEWSGRLLALQLLTFHSYFWALACFLSMERQRIQWGKMIRLLENVLIRRDGLMVMRMSLQSIVISVTLQVIQFHRAQAIEWQKNWTRPASISWHFLRNWLDGLELPFYGWYQRAVVDFTDVEWILWWSKDKYKNKKRQLTFETFVAYWKAVNRRSEYNAVT